jgi:hypothetical protein
VNKRTQKNFDFSVCHRPVAHTRRKRSKSFLVLFFKKELLSILHKKTLAVACQGFSLIRQ